MLLYEFSPTCVSLQEIMIGDTETPHPKDYLSYSTDFDPTRGHNGGCAVFVRYDVAHTRICLQTPLQAVAVQIYIKKKYNHTSVLERFCARTNRCSNKIFEIFLPRWSNKISELELTVFQT